MITVTLKKKLAARAKYFFAASAALVFSSGVFARNIDDPADSLQQVRTAVEANVNDSASNAAFIKAAGKNTELLVKQYDEWIKKNPKSMMLPVMIGTALYEKELPSAKKYLLKAMELDPKYAKGWFMLSIDASRWGDEGASKDYMGKASEADPEDAGYAFYYAMDFEHQDGAIWRKKLYELAKRFPDKERGAQGLYWLAQRSQDMEEKIRVFELLRKSYPPETFNWSSSGMSGLYDAYLMTEPAKAVELAKASGPKDGWPAKITLAEKVVQIRSLLKENKASEAKDLLKNIKIPRYGASIDMLTLLKAEVMNASGDKQGAYDSLIKSYSINPTDQVEKTINSYGSNLKKNELQIKADIWKVRDAAATDAPKFNLDQYLVKGKASLDDYKGKVVLLTFWFPGCGPCRGEFPHFENVLKKYDKSKVVYVGINVLPEQDEYVLPFMKGTKYTFIPLRASSEWAQQTYKVRGEPTNFLIDQDGKMVFRDFRIDESNEHTLELMLNSMIEKKNAPGVASIK